MQGIIDYEAMMMLDLPSEERQTIQERFDDLVCSFTELERIDTNGVEPLVTVLDLHSVLREDVAVKHHTREEILAQAPSEQEGYFQVPGTLA